jgi:CopG family nickel-responsive transcriptional regulator
MSSLIRFGVSIPQELIEQFDARIKAKGYSTRSEAIRDIIRDYLVEGEWEGGDMEVTGTITIVYNHHTRELSNVLTGLQHEFHDAVLCTTHVHLDAHNCLEVIIVRGGNAQVRAIADRLISTRGVKHGKLVCTTTGQSLK